MGVAAQQSGLLVPILLAAGCHYEDMTIYRGFDPQKAAPAKPAQPSSPDVPPIETVSDVFGLLDGKTLVMEGAQIPSHPNGYDEHVNFGQATQCIYRVSMKVQDRNFTVDTEMAMLEGAPQPDDVGQCDRMTPNGETFSFNTTTALIENVQPDGACFDITLTYPGFGQEGRGSFSADRETVTLELFFRDQATGHRCEAGSVGSSTILLNRETFTGVATQLYRLED